MKFFLIDFDGNIFIDEVKNLKNIYFTFPNFKLLPKKPEKKELILKNTLFLLKDIKKLSMK
ncbi:hypothetical protein [Lebetimonas sp. JH292]|uniref:hypothetical protein n=1 Tax=Lebetimonas sp. JH292 TaxID=990068 RepID=UPI0004B1272A|nr:hypothetical protein [Lebetimonas sp. JH292]